jgi:putative serine/threonine protein kinase
MFDHLLPRSFLEEFLRELEQKGVESVSPYSKGTTSLIFLGKLDGRKVVVKLQRPDSPRENLGKEAKFVNVLSLFGITPPLLFSGRFKGLEYLVRKFAEGRPILYAEIEKWHIIEIVLKTALLDRLGIDHGQIQGGKHIIVGKRVYIIDFEKAGVRKPGNLTSAMAMIFLGENSISKRVRDKFSIDRDFLEELKLELKKYKKTGKLSGVLGLLSRL